MEFDAAAFLERYAAAYNDRSPAAMREILAVDDPRFAIFDNFAGGLIDGPTYSEELEYLADAEGKMAFDLIREDRVGDAVLVHGLQRVELEDDEGPLEAIVRATLLVDVAGGSPRILTAHLSDYPSEGGCNCGGECHEEEE
jgi:hypothetical protein